MTEITPIDPELMRREARHLAFTGLMLFGSLAYLAQLFTNGSIDLLTLQFDSVISYGFATAWYIFAAPR